MLSGFFRRAVEWRRNVELLVRCVVRIISRWPAHTVSNPQALLVIQSGKLGDMVCTTPMFRAIKQRFPESKLYVAGAAAYAELLQGNLDVDEYIPLRYGDPTFIEQLRLANLDFACTCNPLFSNLAILLQVNARCVSAPRILGGSCPLEGPGYRFLSQFIVTVPHRMGSYAPGEYLRLLEPIDIRSVDTDKHLVFSEDAGERVSQFLAAHSVRPSDFLVGIAPSVGNHIKRWPAERFAAVADSLFRGFRATIMVIGSKGDRLVIDEMMEQVDPVSRIIDTCNVFTLEELKALIARLSLFVSVDTGPIYIAEAFRIPTVDIIGPMDEREQPPRGRLHRIVRVATREAPALHIMNARPRDTREARRQVEEITTAMVISEIEQLLGVIST